jgi:uncharacterized protein YndB with AHSA1/START domain
MADIVHELVIQAPSERVFAAVSTPAGLDSWWTERSAGKPALGASYALRFGPDFDWQAEVTRFEPLVAFELTITNAGEDWTGTRIALHLQGNSHGTTVQFTHLGWPNANEHYRVTCYCWAMYLRLLRRYVEHGEVVPYERRLDV